MKVKKRILLIIFILFQGTNVLLANSEREAPEIEHHAFDKEAYKKAIEGVDYTETYQPKEEKPDKRNSRKRFNPPDINFSFVGEMFKVFAITAVVLLLGFLIFKLLDEKYSLTNRKIPKGAVLFKELEKYIHDVNLDALLAEALQEGSYKLAIRIYYLIIIKQLSEASLINWKREKTNGEYVAEMFGKNQFVPFKEATVLFERIWYGDVAVDKVLYDTISPRFETLRKSIPVAVNKERE